MADHHDHADPPPDLARRLVGSAWRVMSVAGVPTLADARPTLEFSDDGSIRISGNGSVNRYHGPVSFEHSRLVLGPTVSTMMAGPPERMEQEQRWLRALGDGAHVRFDPADHDDDGDHGDRLALVHPDGSESLLVPIGPFTTVSGVVTYLQRIAMLPGSEIEVVLMDTSVADTVAPVLARQLIRGPGNVPVAFELAVDRSLVGDRAVPALRAAIHTAGELRWTTDTSHHVDLDGVLEGHELVVRPVPTR